MVYRASAWRGSEACLCAEERVVDIERAYARARLMMLFQRHADIISIRLLFVYATVITLLRAAMILKKSRDVTNVILHYDMPLMLMLLRRRFCRWRCARYYAAAFTRLPLFDVATPSCAVTPCYATIASAMMPIRLRYDAAIVCRAATADAADMPLRYADARSSCHIDD